MPASGPRGRAVPAPPRAGSPISARATGGGRRPRASRGVCLAGRHCGRLYSWLPAMSSGEHSSPRRHHHAFRLCTFGERRRGLAMQAGVPRWSAFECSPPGNVPGQRGERGRGGRFGQACETGASMAKVIHSFGRAETVDRAAGRECPHQTFCRAARRPGRDAAWRAIVVGAVGSAGPPGRSSQEGTRCESGTAPAAVSGNDRRQGSTGPPVREATASRWRRPGAVPASPKTCHLRRARRAHGGSAASEDGQGTLRLPPSASAPGCRGPSGPSSRGESSDGTARQGDGARLPQDGAEP